MSERNLEQIFSVADNQLMGGSKPEVEVVAAQLGIDNEEVREGLEHWWQALPGRINIAGRRSVSLPDVPESLTQSFVRIWQQAVQEARSNDNHVRQRHEVGEEESRRINEEALRQSQGVYQELESRYREQTVRLDEARQTIKSLEAEISLLKNNLSAETTERKREEQVRENVEHEMSQMRKQFEDQRRAAEQRLKDEQHKSVETSAKMEVEVRHYRGMLDKLRDEAGKKEAVLTREVHDLQALLARKDVKIDTQKTQINTIEEELLSIKQDVGAQHRDLAKTSSNLLSEANKNKRLEARIKELDDEIRRLNQRATTTSADATRREKALRAQLKERDDELMKAQARTSALEKRAVTQDEEIRRLSARL